jgi:hypothetical protein
MVICSDHDGAVALHCASTTSLPERHPELLRVNFFVPEALTLGEGVWEEGDPAFGAGDQGLGVPRRRVFGMCPRGGLAQQAKFFGHTQIKARCLPFPTFQKTYYDYLRIKGFPMQYV